jgi:hypothetical protein
MTEEVKTETKVVRISEAGSLELWSLLTYLKGRKKSLIALLGVVLGYVITDGALAAILSGVVLEGAFSIVEFYLSKVEVK